MNIDYNKSFDKQFAKLSRIQKQLVIDTVELFINDPFDDNLRNHPLKDKWNNYRSITADYDLRLHYRVINQGTILFVAVGTQAQLYK
jgi:addiction module RelE/StbE family toxin